ncbi:MAG: toxic anion resistance protein [Spirochaetaceae bacterium]
MSTTQILENANKSTEIKEELKHAKVIENAGDSVKNLNSKEIAVKAGSVSPENILEEEIPEEVKNSVAKLVVEIKGFGKRDIDAKTAFSDKTKSIGLEIRKGISHRSELLSAPMKDLMEKNKEGGDISTGLLTLRGKMESINPNSRSLTDGGLRKLFSKIPGVGSKLEAWWSQYQTVSRVIDDIYVNLERGKEVLQKDNISLRADKNSLIKIVFTLADKIQETMLFDSEIVKLVDSGELTDIAFVEEDILYSLRQETQDMQLSLGAANQAIMVADIIIRGNDELIRATDRTLNLAKIALESAAAMEIALMHQKRQKKAIDATNEFIAETMKSTSEKAKTQGVDIIKSANDLTSLIDALKISFNNSVEAFDILDTYKREQLTVMADNIESLGGINKEMSKHVERVQ